MVLFWSLDRFSREGILETLQHLRHPETAGVAWRSYTESYFDSSGPFKDAVVAIMASLAKLERQKISERTKAGLKRARREGKLLGRPRIVVDVQKIRKLQARGMALRGIAEETGWSLSSIMRELKGCGRIERAQARQTARRPGSNRSVQVRRKQCCRV